jgi:hypothetical protein
VGIINPARIERVPKRDIMKDLRTLAVVCIALLVVCLPRATARAEGHHQSGIAGQVVGGTWSPEVETPVQCSVRIVDERGKTFATVETDANGLFCVALKPGSYRLKPFIPLWILFNGEWMYGELAGPPAQVTVDKKDYSEIVMPFGFFDDWGFVLPGWPEWPWLPGWELEIWP